MLTANCRRYNLLCMSVSRNGAFQWFIWSFIILMFWYLHFAAMLNNKFIILNLMLFNLVFSLSSSGTSAHASFSSFRITFFSKKSKTAVLQTTDTLLGHRHSHSQTKCRPVQVLLQIYWMPWVLICIKLC